MRIHAIRMLLVNVICNKDRATTKQSNYMEFFQLVLEENNTDSTLIMKKNLVWFRWNCETCLLRNLINIISSSFPFLAFHHSFIFIFNFSVFWPLQSYLRLLVTSSLRNLKTPWQSGWRIWQNTVLNSVLGKWKFLMDLIGASKLWVKCCIHQGFLSFHDAHLPLIAQSTWVTFAGNWLFIKGDSRRRFT